MGLFVYLDSMKKSFKLDISQNNKKHNQPIENADSTLNDTQKETSDNKKKKSFFKKRTTIKGAIYRPFKITLCVLLILIVGVLCSWWINITEIRNQFVDDFHTKIEATFSFLDNDSEEIAIDTEIPDSGI